MSDPLTRYHFVRFCGLTGPGYMCRTLPPGLLQSPSVGFEDFDFAVSAGDLHRRAWVSNGVIGLTRPWNGIAPPLSTRPRDALSAGLAI